MTETFNPIAETIKNAEIFARKRKNINVHNTVERQLEMYDTDVKLYLMTAHNIRMEELAQEHNEILHSNNLETHNVGPR